jgi:YggT family protein
MLDVMSPAVASALIQVLEVYLYIVLARVLLSWIVRDPGNPLVRILGALTDPIMAPLSRVLTFSGIDLSPIVVIMGIKLLQRVIASTVSG